MNVDPLAIIPTYVTTTDDVAMLDRTLRSLREKTPDGHLDIMVVDDGSPDIELRAMVYEAAGSWDATVLQRPENVGFSKTVNWGLRKALEEQRDAILVNSDIEILTKDWVTIMAETEGDVVGAMLIYPSGLIQHGGIYFSLLTRDFQHLWRFAPPNLPAARELAQGPVTGALQYIRYETLTRVGLYDEDYRMGFEDVDFCLRVAESGGTCIYQPKVRALHHESVFRGRQSERLDQWHKESLLVLWKKWGNKRLDHLVPFR